MDRRSFYTQSHSRISGSESLIGECYHFTPWWYIIQVIGLSPPPPMVVAVIFVEVIILERVK